MKSVEAYMLLAKKNALEKMLLRITDDNSIIADWDIGLIIKDANSDFGFDDHFASILLKIAHVSGRMGPPLNDRNRKFKILVNIKAPLSTYNLNGTREPEDSWVLADKEDTDMNSTVFPCKFFETREFKVHALRWLHLSQCFSSLHAILSVMIRHFNDLVKVFRHSWTALGRI